MTIYDRRFGDTFDVHDNCDIYYICDIDYVHTYDIHYISISLTSIILMILISTLY